MYFPLNSEITFSKSNMSWWRQLTPYQLFIRTDLKDEDSGKTLELLALTCKMHSKEVEIWHEYFEPKESESLIQDNNFQFQRGSYTISDFTAYMAKMESDTKRLEALLDFALRQGHRVLTDYETDISLISVLQASEMKICKSQKWATDMNIPLRNVTVNEKIAFINSKSYDGFRLDDGQSIGTLYEVDNFDGTLLFYKALLAFNHLIAEEEIDSAYLQDSYDLRIEQMERFFLSTSICKGQKAIQKAGITGLQILCFEYEYRLHWGLFIPDCITVPEQTLDDIMDAAALNYP